jgi:transitional endoplasmic reticulum ATPase
MATAPTTERVSSVPEFARELDEVIGGGETHAVLLHGNVKDYARPGRTMRDYIARLFLAGGEADIVVWYNRAAGIRFVDVTTKGAAGGEVVGLRATEQAERFFQVLAGPAADDGLAGITASEAPEVDHVADAATMRSPAQAFAAIERVLWQSETRALVVIEYAETVAPAGEPTAMGPADRDVLVTLQTWAAEQQIGANGHTILFLAEEAHAVHPALRSATSRVRQIEVSVPNHRERLAFVGAIEDAGEIPFAVDREEFARLTAGLTRLSIEDVALTARRRGVPVDRELVLERTRALMEAEYGDVLRLLEPAGGFETVGGLKHVKQVLTEEVIEPLKRGDRKHTPVGILIPGAPGTGKTYVTAALAWECHATCFELDPGALTGMYKGESEAKLEKAIRAILSLGRVVVVIDEVDQSFHRQGAGAGHDAAEGHKFQRILRLFNDESLKGRVIVVGLTNRPDNVDAALKRLGRLGDLVVPFTPPDAEDRAEVIAIHGRRYFGDGCPDDLGFAQVPAAGETVVAATDGWTPNELAGLVRKASKLLAAGRAVNEYDAIGKAVGRLRNTTADVRAQTLLALAEVSDLDLLPPAYEKAARDPKLGEKIAAARGRAVDRSKTARGGLALDDE